MQSLSFTPGRALFESSPVNRTWSLRFEDEGIAGYLYVCDRALGHGDESILDSMLIYNVAALRDAGTRAAQESAAQESALEESTLHDRRPTTGTAPEDAPAATAAHDHESLAQTDAPHASAGQTGASSGSTTPATTGQGTAAPEPERLAAIEWSRDGLQAVFYLDGTAQAMADFTRRISFCRSDFPNFLAEGTERWRASSHAWDPAAIEHFEAALYA